MWRHDASFKDMHSSLPRLDDTVREVVSRSSLSPARQRQWIKALKHGDRSSFIAVLLTTLPNLRCINLAGLRWPMRPVGELFQSAAKRENFLSTQPALSALGVFILECKSYNGRICISHNELSSYLELPSLREFYGEQICVNHHLFDGPKANK